MTQEELNKQLQERFKQLPKVVQDSITSADVQKQLRALADTNKLHLDQWQVLENDVMLTLLGFQDPDELPSELKNDLEVSDDVAKVLAADISRIVFQPIREELERELASPTAKESTVSDVEAAGKQMIAAEVEKPGPAPVAPATPPNDAPTEKSTRAPMSEAYKAGEVSSQRKAVADDPYREPLS